MHKLGAVLIVAMLFVGACGDGGEDPEPARTSPAPATTSPTPSPSPVPESLTCGDGPGSEEVELFAEKEGPYKLQLSSENLERGQQFDAIVSFRAEYVGGGQTIYVYVHQYGSAESACDALQVVAESWTETGYEIVDEVPVGTAEDEQLGPATQLEEPDTGQPVFLWTDGDLVVEVTDQFSGEAGYALEFLGYLSY